MATFHRFEDIESWKKARELTTLIYKITSIGNFARDFGLRDQIRRASVSIASNIAEGFERDGTKEFVQFLYIAKGSAGEVKTQCDDRPSHRLGRELSRGRGMRASARSGSR